MLRYSTLLAAMIGCFALQYASADARGAYGANRAGCEISKPQLTTAPGTPGPNYWIAQDGLFAAAGQKAIYAGLPPRERHEPPGTYPVTCGVSPPRLLASHGKVWRGDARSDRLGDEVR